MEFWINYLSDRNKQSLKNAETVLKIGLTLASAANGAVLKLSNNSGLRLIQISSLVSMSLKLCQIFNNTGLFAVESKGLLWERNQFCHLTGNVSKWLPKVKNDTLVSFLATLRMRLGEFTRYQHPLTQTNWDSGLEGSKERHNATEHSFARIVRSYETSLLELHEDNRHNMDQPCTPAACVDLV